MTVEFRKCYPKHIEHMIVQDVQTGEQAWLLAGGVSIVEQSTIALSAWAGGRCLGAAGLLDVWPGRALAWTLLSKYAPPHMRAITRHVRFCVNAYPARRVEMVVLRSFVQGHRWATMLGFEYEGHMRAYFQDGTDASLYARIKHGSGS